MFQPNASVSVMAGGRTPVDGKRLGEQMSKKIPGLFALLAFLGLSLFLINCGSSSSRPAGVLYVLSQGENNVGSFAIDLGSGRLSLINNTASTCPTLTQTPPVPCGFPGSIVLDPTGAIVFVLDQGAPPVAPTIYAYSVQSDGSLTATGTPTPLFADDMSVAMTRDAGGNFLLVANQNSNTVSAFGTQPGSATLTSIGSVFVGNGPVAVAIDPSGKFFYVVNQTDNTVGEYDLASGVQMVGSPYATGSVPNAVVAVTTTPTGGAGGLFVYVANGGSGSGANSVSIFQVCTVANATCTAQDVTDAIMIPVGTPVSVGLNPVAMTVDPTNNFLYVVNHGSSTLSAFRINPTTGELSALNPSSVSTGSSPVAITMHSSGKFLYVSNNASSNISGFDVSTTNGALSNATNVTSSAQPAGLAAR
jgi:6-phosphogluconolactonase (cycloisomerase 2 family)